jgi:penicillin-insensitive murein endopeptidase
MRILSAVALLMTAAAAATAVAQSPADTTPKSEDQAAEALPASKGKPGEPAAKTLFGAAKTPAPLEARAIGFYSRGCLSGAKPLAVDGSAWQAMRLSRNRNWGHPDLVAWVERFAINAQQDGWPGLLVGDLSQPRGGPMLTGHASHQIGLDADIWLTPMPSHRLTSQEREDMSAVSMLAADKVSVDPAVWSQQHAKLIRRAASYSEVERVLVHPAIKKALCDIAPTLGEDRLWLGKVRPYWGHHYHFHVRLSCPPDSTACKSQPPPSGDDGCGKEVTDWLALVARPPKPPDPTAKPKPPPAAITLSQLPPECRVVLETGPGARSSDARGQNSGTR